MILTLNKDGNIPLEYFKELLDISEIRWYTIKVRKDKSLIIKFYNKDKKLMKLGSKNAKKRKKVK